MTFGHKTNGSRPIHKDFIVSLIMKILFGILKEIMKETEICFLHKYPPREKNKAVIHFYEELLGEDKLLRGLFWVVSRIHGFKWIELNQYYIYYCMTWFFSFRTEAYFWTGCSLNFSNFTHGKYECTRAQMFKKGKIQ